VAKSPKKPRRGGEHDPAVNTAAGAPSKGVSVDPAVNTAAGAPSKGVSVDPAVNTAADAPSMGVSVDPAVNTAAGAPSKANNVAKQPRTCVGAECDIECVVGLTCCICRCKLEAKHSGEQPTEKAKEGGSFPNPSQYIRQDTSSSWRRSQSRRARPKFS